MTEPPSSSWFWRLVSSFLHWRDRLHARLIERDGAVLLVLVAVAAVGVGVYFKGRPLYVQWRGARAVAQARDFLRRNERENAQLALQVAFRSEPTAAAYTALADFLEAGESNEAVEARRLAAELEPADAALRLAGAATALRFNDTAAARVELAACPPAAKTTEAYLRVAAAYALIAGEFDEATRYLRQLGERTGETPELRLLRAAVGVNDARPEAAARARRDLRELAREPAQRLPALRVLVADALAKKNPLLAGEVAAEIVAAPGALFSDLLNAAAAEKFARPATGVDPGLRRTIEAQAAREAPAAVHYARWLLAQENAAAAAAWLGRLNPDFAQTPLLLAIRADVAALRGDEPELRRLLALGAWGPLPADGLEFAFAARLARGLGEPEVARRAWAQALEETRTSAAGLRALAHLAAAWQWPEAKREALFLTVRQFRTDTVAFLQLAKELRAARDTRGLRDLYRLFADGSTRFEAKLQDWALLSLLTSPARAPNEATQTLQALHVQRPGNSYYATNHAFALCQLKKFREAAALIDALPAADRQAAERAPYVAFIYASAGRRDEARAALRRSPPAAALLPEEAELLKRAVELIGR
ncbi:MAG: hypothetical protein HY302_16705 [Opitutae bacterium]|nr:hypothetical protein [Opitutae bacterium]